MTNFRPTTLSPEALKIWDEADANIKASMQRIRELTAPLRRPGSAGLKEEAMTTAPDFRDLCADLLWQTELYTGLNPAASEMSSCEKTERVMDAMAATRTALATPPPKPPTAIEIIDLSIEIDDAGLGIVEFASAVLERWGHG